MREHIRRTWHEWEFDDKGRVGVVVFETDLQTDPIQPGYDEEMIRRLIEWIEEAEGAKSLRSAMRFRIVPTSGSNA